MGSVVFNSFTKVEMKAGFVFYWLNEDTKSSVCVYEYSLTGYTDVAEVCSNIKEM